MSENFRGGQLGKAVPWNSAVRARGRRTSYTPWSAASSLCCESRKSVMGEGWMIVSLHQHREHGPDTGWIMRMHIVLIYIAK